MNLRYLFFFWSLVLAIQNGFAADEIHWTITGQNSVTFDWRDTSGTGKENSIRVGTASGKYTQLVTAITPSPLPTSSRGPFWEAKITGLRENTQYYYSIANGPEHKFRTLMPSGSSNFIVFAEGDVSSSLKSPWVRPIQHLIATDLPRFVLVLGDLSYGDSLGNAVVDQHFNDVMVWSLEAAYMPSWGNHDWDNSTSKIAQINEYEGRFDFPNSQSSPGSEKAVGNGPGEDWYWFDYGNVRFIAYPEPYTAATWPEWNTKVKLIMDEAQLDPNIKFIVTFGHRPAYSSGYHSGSLTLKNFLDALGDSHNKYVLNINGHSHNYERSFPQHGVIHVTAGTGGASLETRGWFCLYMICPKPAWSAFRAMHHGITRLHITNSGIEGSFICGPAETLKKDIRCSPGEKVDSFTIVTPEIAEARHWSPQ